MSKILVCQHVAYEILGTLNPLLKEHGCRIRYVNFDREPDAQPELDGYEGLVILGGPMNVAQVDQCPHLMYEVQLIRAALEQDIPILGICLGAQLLAVALGAEVNPNPCKEIGWYDMTLTADGSKDPLFGHFSQTEKIFQWHGDTFEIPKGAVHLAASETCPNQAFRYGDKVYGFQFHLEVDAPMVHRWLQVPHHVQEIEALGGAIDPEQIRRETSQYIGKSMALSAQSFGAFVTLLGSKQRSQRLPSR